MRLQTFQYPEIFKLESGKRIRNLEIAYHLRVGWKSGGIGNALKEIKANTLVIGIKNDLLFPIVEQKLLANSISNAQYFEIN